jgi:hypothetical protein
MKDLRTTAFLLLVLLMGGLLPSCRVSPNVGGGCKYDDFPGTVTIKSIEKTEASKQQKASIGYEGFEVLLTFKPDGAMKDGIGTAAVQRDHLFQLGSGTYPGPAYLKKYHLEAGKTYRGTMSVITAGTCTPVIVKMDGVDPIDFFEGRK